MMRRSLVNGGVLALLTWLVVACANPSTGSLSSSPRVSVEAEQAIGPIQSSAVPIAESSSAPQSSTQAAPGPSSQVSPSPSSQVSPSPEGQILPTGRVDIGPYDLWQLHGEPFLSWNISSGPETIQSLRARAPVIVVGRVTAVKRGSVIDTKDPAPIVRDLVTVTPAHDPSRHVSFLLTRAGSFRDVTDAELMTKLPKDELVFVLAVPERPSDHPGATHACWDLSACVLEATDTGVRRALEDSVISTDPKLRSPAALAEALGGVRG